MWLKRTALGCGLGLGFLHGTSLLFDENDTLGESRVISELVWGYRNTLRTLRGLKVCSVVYLDYVYSLRGLDEATTEYQETKKQVHERCAERIHGLCASNSGLYIKAGQYLGSFIGILPREYHSKLRMLQDKAPSSHWTLVSKELKKSLGHLVDEKFSVICKEPVASGTLAQVHRGTLRSGCEVAIKIQHPGLKSTIAFDLHFLELVVTFIKWKTDDVDLTQVLSDYKKSIVQEIDFKAELKNMKEAKSCLKGVPFVMVPAAHEELCTSNVITMEFADGIKYSDKESITSQGLSYKKVISRLYDFLSHQIFVDGFVHSDPHPGNILVRRDPKDADEVQLVILDHGLYHRFDEEFRRDLCQLWMDLVSVRIGGSKKFFEKYGIPLQERVIASIILKDVWAMGKDKIRSKLHLNTNNQVKKPSELAIFMRTEGKKWMNDFHRLPESLLCFIKIENLLYLSIPKEERHLNKRIQIFTKNAWRGIHKE